MNLEQYYTANELIQMVEPHLTVSKDDVCFEPCVGIGQIPFNLHYKWEVNDITNGWDATEEKNWEDLDFDIDWVITNPPFRPGLKILEHSVKYAEKGVAFLVRMSFLEPTKDRYEFFAKHPPTGMVFCPRPHFLLPKTGDEEKDKRFHYNNEYNFFHDSQSCVWIIWDFAKEPMNVNWYPKPKTYNWRV